MAEPRRPALFFQSAAQLQSLRDTRPGLLESAALVGLSSLLSPGQAAGREALEFYPYTDFLSAEAFSAAAKEAQEVSRTWLAAPAMGLEIGTIGEGLLTEPEDAEVLEAIRLEVLQPLHEILVAQRVISRALEALKPAEVWVAPGLDEKVSAVLEYEAEQRGIQIVGAGLKPARAGMSGLPAGGVGQAGRSGLSGRASRLLRSLTQAAHNALLLAGFWRRQRLGRRPVLLAFGAGVDSINQQRLLPAVEADGRVRPLLLRAGETDSSMLNRPGKSEFPVLHFVPWNAMLRAGRHLPGCRRRWQAFEAGQATYRGKYPFLFANTRLSPFFARLYLHLLPHALATRQDVRTWLKRLHPELVFTSNDVSFPVRSLVLEARRQGVPTLGLIHSGLNNMHYRDFQSVRMAVWGEVHVRDFQRVLGKGRSSLLPIGNPQYDTFGQGEAGEPSTPTLRTPRVVVLTAVAQWQMLYYNQREHLRAWRELERLPEHGIHVTIKPHPRFDDYAFYSGLQHPLAGWREEGPGISVARDAFLEEVVPGCDLVIVPNLPTTGGVEAMMLAKPVIHLMCGFDEADCCTSIAAGCLVVRDVEQIVPAVLGVLGSREQQEELVQKGQAYLDDLVGPRDRLATRRLGNLIAGVVASETHRIDRPRCAKGEERT